MTRQAHYLIASAVCYAGLILAHSLTALIFSPLLLIYILILRHEFSSPLLNLTNYLRTMLGLWGALGIGLGLAAFYWLPAWWERLVIADFLLVTPDLDYHHNFIPLTALLTEPFSTTPRPGLSLLSTSLAVVGLLDLQRRRLAVRKHGLFAVLAASGCTLMALPVAVNVWEALPLLHFFQFPHRFLGVATLFVALLAGVGAEGVRSWFSPRQRINEFQPRVSPSWPTLAVPLLLGGLFLSQTWVLAQVHYYPPLPNIDMNFIMQKERESGQIGTLYIAHFVPTTVKTLPPFELLARDGLKRLDLASLPAGATIITSTYYPLRYNLTLTSPTSFSARFNTFYFPGWQAQLDGQAISITPTDPHGLISVQVPAGQHQLIIWFGSTPIRTLANLLTIGAVVILGVILAVATIFRG